MIMAVTTYGAAGFYLGIDLPPAPQKIRELSPRGFGSRADAVELLSAAGHLSRRGYGRYCGKQHHSRRGYTSSRRQGRVLGLGFWRVDADRRRHHCADPHAHFLT
ncbi:hypothetical protein ACVWY2_000119 [Bradyrhizobium sp. JR6.1]